MLPAEAASELLETTLSLSVEPYLSGACSFLDIAEEQVQLVSECFTQEILSDTLENHYDASNHSIGSDNDRQALLFVLLVLTTRGGTGVPLEDSYIATQLLARLVPLSADFIDLILCAFAGVISSGITILEQASLQGKARSKTLFSYSSKYPKSYAEHRQLTILCWQPGGLYSAFRYGCRTCRSHSHSSHCNHGYNHGLQQYGCIFRESPNCTPQLNTLTYLELWPRKQWYACLTSL